jgi:hypothetical protein
MILKLKFLKIKKYKWNALSSAIYYISNMFSANNGIYLRKADNV